ncbi:unnamed protein product [Prunus armeniaca]
MPPPTPTILTSKTLVVGSPTLLTRRLMASNSKSNGDMAKRISVSPISSFPSYGDPCQDLFFHVKPADTVSDDDMKQQQNQASLNYLKQLLPVAWSHNPLTTLKLIFNLLAIRSSRKSYQEGFYKAVFWLHQNHPKTLLCNLPSIAHPFGSFFVLLEILYRLIEQGQDVAERLHCDPDYKLLHDQVMDVFVEQLKSDIDKFKQHKLDLKPSDYITDGDEDEEEDDDDEDDKDGTLDADTYADLFVSEAAVCCISKHPEDTRASRAVLLYESIARRLFPPKPDQSNQSYQSYQSQEWERLRNEVLAPLYRYWNRQGMFIGRHRSEVKMYLEEVKKAGGGGGNLSGHGSIIKPDAMLPNEIIRYVVEDGDVGEAAELQWKAMVEDMYLKQQQQQMQGQGLGKFKDCLAVCHINDFMGIRGRELAVSLGLLVSELSEGTAWKGKVISSGHLPDQLLLHSIEGDDLKSKCEFMMRTCSSELGSYVHNWKIWDVILEVAVKENLKAEQMVKKVFVFTDFGYGGGTFLKTLYEAKQSQFKEQGYGDNAVPHILLWNIGYWNKLCIEHHPGVTLLSGFSENLLKSFLDNGGEIGRCHLMEAAIADKEYQALSVVD